MSNATTTNFSATDTYTVAYRLTHVTPWGSEENCDYEDISVGTLGEALREAYDRYMEDDSELDKVYASNGACVYWNTDAEFKAFENWECEQ